MNRQAWYDATVRGGVGGGARAKYKSSYMKRGFTASRGPHHLQAPHPRDPGRQHRRHPRRRLLRRRRQQTRTREDDIHSTTRLGPQAPVSELLAEPQGRCRPSASGCATSTPTSTQAPMPIQRIKEHLGTTHQYEGCYINYPTPTCSPTPSGPSFITVKANFTHSFRRSNSVTIPTTSSITPCLFGPRRYNRLKRTRFHVFAGRFSSELS